MACESEPPWPGEPDRRSGSDERELVSSLEPQPLSLELSVGTAVPVKWKDLLFGRRVKLSGEGISLHGRYFPVDSGSLQNRSQRTTLAHCRTQVFVQPLGGRGARADSGAAAGVKPTGASPQGGEPARPARKTWLCAVFARFAALGEFPESHRWGNTTTLHPPSSITEEEKKFVVVLFCFLNRHL